MTNDEIERIAESLGVERHPLHGQFSKRGKKGIYCWKKFPDDEGNIGGDWFNPYTNWQDTGLVLEAYLKLVIDDIYKDPDFDIHSVSLDITGWHKRPKEAICQAYLSSIQGNRS